MSRTVTPALTIPQALALLDAAAEAEAGEMPATAGATLKRAIAKLAAALTAADPNWAEG